MCRPNFTYQEKKIIDNFKNNNKKVCIYCGKKLELNNTTCDHLVPISRGGKTTIENLGLCDEHCNVEKSDMTPEEYITYLELKNITLNNNVVLNQINTLVQTYENIINSYTNNNLELSNLNREKIELEIIIRDEIHNASQGYFLYKESKDILIKLQEKQSIQKSSRRSYDFSKNNIKAVIEEKLNLERVLMNAVRTQYSIGRIGQLGIDKIEFKVS